MKISHLVCTALLAAPVLFAAEWYVDHEQGKDTNPGSKELPFQTFKRCLKSLKGGDTLHIVPTKTPYNERIGELKKQYSGTAEKPTVIDGHGALFERLEHFTADKWKNEENNIYSLKFKHNVVSMSGQGYYSGFPFVRVDGKLIPCVKKKEDLKPNTCLLILKWLPKLNKHDPLHNTLFVCLPEGKTPANTKIILPVMNNIAVDCDYIIIKNLTSNWNSADSFDTTWKKGIVFENVSAEWCMDQCISHHATLDVEARYCVFKHAIDGGALDISMGVNPHSDIRYKACIFEQNTRMGAISCRGSSNMKFTISDCIIRDNDGVGIEAEAQSQVFVDNCALIRGKGNAPHAFRVGTNGPTLTVKNCLIDGFSVGLWTWESKKNVKFENCVFKNVKVILQVCTGDVAKFSFENCVFPEGAKFIGPKNMNQEKMIAAGMVLKNCVRAKDPEQKYCTIDPTWDKDQLRKFVEGGKKNEK